MKIDRVGFFTAWRPALGAIRDKAVVAAVERVLGFVETDPDLTDQQQIAYVLATIHHETARTWRPIPEYGRGNGKDYGDECVLARGVRAAYYGRGFVQLTWLCNYGKASAALGIDIVSDPELALNPEIAWQIISAGMRRGWFTGKTLDDYIGGGKADYKNARRIVNGLDKAAEIAFYAERFEVALKAATKETP